MHLLLTDRPKPAIYESILALGSYGSNREFPGHHTNQACYKSGIMSPEYKYAEQCVSIIERRGNVGFKD
jgi:hypothetical protein